ncbi:MAG: DUF5752 family protein [Dehalococcoidales bacterium]|nr:DUF5752 family protein [Dehalococcoidales bacterium]
MVKLAKDTTRGVSSTVGRITRLDAMKFLSRVPAEYAFKCNDSCVINDLKELAQSLNTMSDQTFFYHANNLKNDFSTWISDVIGDQELADNLRNKLDRTDAARAVADRIAFLTRRAA